MIRAAALSILLSALPAAASAQDLRATALKVHNAERDRLSLPPLVWDEDLARQAAVWARALTAKGRLEHSPRDQRPGQGENLSMGTRGFYTPTFLMQAWVEERKDYLHRPFPEISRTGDWKDVGHYTQVVWRDTTAVGCAVASSRQWDYVVCRYSPPGNYMGERAY
jgi:hypothetical protein